MQSRLKSFSGTVIQGEQVGRTMGFPSANFAQSPADGSMDPGVYLCSTQLSGQTYYGLAYYGPRFVHGEYQNTFEVFFYDFSGNLYGQKITVNLHDFIRRPIKFESLEDVKHQLEKDKKVGLKIIKTIG